MLILKGLEIKNSYTYVVFCLFEFILYVPVNNFPVMFGNSRVERVLLKQRLENVSLQTLECLNIIFALSIFTNKSIDQNGHSMSQCFACSIMQTNRGPQGISSII